jgi:hypothetical protein
MGVAVDLHTAGTEQRRAAAEGRRLDRMAELVAELTGCDATGARHALRDDEVRVDRDPLAHVARAMIAMGRPHPLREPVWIDPGYLEVG